MPGTFNQGTGQIFGGVINPPTAVQPVGNMSNFQFDRDVFIFLLQNATEATVTPLQHQFLEVSGVTCQFQNGEVFLPKLLRVDPVTMIVYYSSSFPVTGRIIIF